MGWGQFNSPIGLWSGLTHFWIILTCAWSVVVSKWWFLCNTHMMTFKWKLVQTRCGKQRTGCCAAIWGRHISSRGSRYIGEVNDSNPDRFLISRKYLLSDKILYESLLSELKFKENYEADRPHYLHQKCTSNRKRALNTFSRHTILKHVETFVKNLPACKDGKYPVSLVQWKLKRYAALHLKGNLKVGWPSLSSVGDKYLFDFCILKRLIS